MVATMQVVVVASWSAAFAAPGASLRVSAAISAALAVRASATVSAGAPQSPDPFHVTSTQAPV